MTNEALLTIPLAEYNKKNKTIEDLEFRILLLEDPKTVIKITEYHASNFRFNKRYESVINGNELLEQLVGDNKELNYKLTNLEIELDLLKTRLSHEKYNNESLTYQLKRFRSSFFYKLYLKWTR
jgi:hypothetical protein